MGSIPLRLRLLYTSPASGCTAVAAHVCYAKPLLQRERTQGLAVIRLSNHILGVSALQQFCKYNSTFLMVTNTCVGATCFRHMVKNVKFSCADKIFF